MANCEWKEKMMQSLFEAQIGLAKKNEGLWLGSN
jgi:hypothetical protein